MNSFKKQKDPQAQSPKWVTEEGPRFKVESQEEVQQKQAASASFAYTKQLMADIVMSIPLSERLLNELPLARKELREVLIMSLVSFMQLIYASSNSSIKDWDNSTLQSRIALAMTISTSFKFVMDTQPVGPSFCLTCVLKPGEFEVPPEALCNYLEKYDTIVLKRINLYRCYFNHYAWAQQSMEDMASDGRVSTVVAEAAEDLLFFFSYNLVEHLPRYCHEAEDAVGPAIALLSIYCMAVSGFSIETHTPIQDNDAYVMACGMAKDMRSKTTQDTQKHLYGVYTDRDYWQSRVTQPRNIESALWKLDSVRPRAPACIG